MSSTVGHGLCGATILMAARAANPRARFLAEPRWLALFAVAANLPDVDLLVGLAFGNFGRFHGGPTHSLVFAAAAAAVMGVLLPARHRRLVFPWLAAAVFSHALMDFLAGPALGWHRSYGARLFWPFDGGRIRCPFSLFLGVENSTAGRLLNAHNVLVVAVEMVSFAVPLWGLWRVVRSRGGKSALCLEGAHE